MTRFTPQRPELMLAAAATAVLVAIGGQWSRLARAEGRWRQECTRHAQVERDLAERAELVSKQATIAESPRPTQEVLTQIRRVLSEVGIPSQQLESIEPQADTREARGTDERDTLEVREQSFLVSLRALPPIEVGRFLQRWVESEPLWTPTRIELAHESGGAEVGRYRVGLWLSAEYWTDGREGARP